VSGLAHYFEDEGLATVIVALVREHAEVMRPPRTLWVPFELGRPFGAPYDNGLQTRVLRAALGLLNKPGPGPLLEDYLEEAPYPQGQDGWQFPGKLDNSSLLAEAASIHPFWEQARHRHGRSTVGVSGLEPQAATEYVARYHSKDPLPNPKGMATISRARFAVDDIKAYYLEAATAREGHPSSHQLNEWFWEQTLAGEMIRDFQQRISTSEDKNENSLTYSLVPAERTNSWRQ
jgi:hypothetical protein